jgi:hypothetical protein
MLSCDFDEENPFSLFLEPLAGTRYLSDYRVVSELRLKFSPINVSNTKEVNAR